MHCARWVPAATAGFAIVMSACTFTPVVERIIVERLVAGTPAPALLAAASASPEATANATPSPTAIPSTVPTPEPILKRRGSLIVVAGLRLPFQAGTGNVEGYLNPITGATRSEKVAPVLEIAGCVGGPGAPMLASIEAYLGGVENETFDEAGFPRKAPKKYADLLEGGFLYPERSSGVFARAGDAILIEIADGASGPGGVRWMKVTITRIDTCTATAPEIVFDYVYQTATGSRALE